MGLMGLIGPISPISPILQFTSDNTGPPMSAPLVRLVARVRRRLFLQTFGRRFVVLGTAALLTLGLTLLCLAQGHFRGDPWSVNSPLFLARFAWLAGVAGLSAGAAGLMAWLR